MRFELRDTEPRSDQDWEAISLSESDLGLIEAGLGALVDTHFARNGGVFDMRLERVEELLSALSTESVSGVVSCHGRKEL